MKKLYALFAVLALLVVGVVIEAQATGCFQPPSIPIQNPSFEQVNTVYGDQTCGENFFGIVGWKSESDSSYWSGNSTLRPSGNPTGSNPCRVATPVPDGANAAQLLNNRILQDLGVKFSDIQKSPQGTCCIDGLYVMKFSLTTVFGPYSGYYEAHVSLGNTDANGVIHVGEDLCYTTGWSTQKWNQVILTCPAPGGLIANPWPGPAGFDPRGGHDDVILSLSEGPDDRGQVGWQLLFDDVSLTFTPQQ
jgi:hypothetical protein